MNIFYVLFGLFMALPSLFAIWADGYIRGYNAGLKKQGGKL